MKFTKMHGCGNDYIYINLIQDSRLPKDKSSLAKRLCNRHFGIGGDGLIFLLPSHTADFKMEIYNADGSLAEMCGNGIRCATKLFYEQLEPCQQKQFFTVEIGNAIKKVDLIFQNRNITAARVNMGKPEFQPEKIPVISAKPIIFKESFSIDTQPFEITCLSMGNPHCVLFTKDFSSINIHHIGSLLEHHQMFPNGTNVIFVQVITPSRIYVRIWERGTGETLSCGTGCCAAVVAGVLNHFTNRRVTVQTLGGELYIYWDNQTNNVFMTGPMETVFEGNVSDSIFY